LKSCLRTRNAQHAIGLRRFVQEEVQPEIVACHRAAKFPEHLTARMGALGFFAPFLKEHGCAGLSYTAYGLIMQELERADSGLRSEASVQGALAIYAIHSFGVAGAACALVAGIGFRVGQRVGCFALTEHGHGSDPGGMETNAKRDGDHYILNGSKCWIGNASIADVKVVWAKDDDGASADSLSRKMRLVFADKILRGNLACACHARRSVGSKIAGYRPRTACPRLLGCAHHYLVFRRRGWVLRGV